MRRMLAGLCLTLTLLATTSADAALRAQSGCSGCGGCGCYSSGWLFDDSGPVGPPRPTTPPSFDPVPVPAVDMVGPSWTESGRIYFTFVPKAK